ncbi:hypothetical protein CAL7716_107000 (plasmid) [Calothrix sp. PCC 7716]|nr:hypothetical protein CAL7716_107000 [Calothrix sp. PCC 7716]
MKLQNMTKLFALLLIIFSSSVSPAFAQLENDCINSRKVGRVDSKTPVCLSEKDLIFFVARRNQNNRLSSYVSITLEKGKRIVTVSEDKNMTIFYLNGRAFESWLTNPNKNLVEKYRRDITAILDGIEQYGKHMETMGEVLKIMNRMKLEQMKK